MTADTRSHRARAARGWLLRRAGLAVGAIALADWLFFNGHSIGMSLPLFFAACGALLVAMNPIRASGRLLLLCGLMSILALAALAEDVSWLSMTVAGITVLYLARLIVGGGAERWPQGLTRALNLPLVGPFRLASDVTRVFRISGPGRSGVRGAASLVAWIVPIFLSLAFVRCRKSADPRMAGRSRSHPPARPCFGSAGPAFSFGG